MKINFKYIKYVQKYEIFVTLFLFYKNLLILISLFFISV